MTKLLGVNRVNKQNRIVIPQKVMETLQLSKGDYILFGLDEEGRIKIERIDYPK